MLVLIFLLSLSITNLKYWGADEMILIRTLRILNDLSIGYTSVRKLVQLDEIQFLLHNHTVNYSIYTDLI